MELLTDGCSAAPRHRLDVAAHYHRRAMAAADWADQFARVGRPGLASVALRHAVFLAHRAVCCLPPDCPEPTRGVLHRSAACLALRVGLHRAARWLATRGLAGPGLDGRTRGELKDVLTEVGAAEAWEP